MKPPNCIQLYRSLVTSKEEKTNVNKIKEVHKYEIAKEFDWIYQKRLPISTN